jgi:hypothetical protein
LGTIGAINELAGMAIRSTLERARKDPTNFDPEFARRAIKDLKNMMPMSWDDLRQAFRDKGWIAVKEIDGEKVLTTKKLGGEEEGYAASVLEVILTSKAGHVKNLADSFLMKAKPGSGIAEPTQEGLLLARELMHISDFGALLLGWDQSVGRGLRQRGLIKGVSYAGESAMQRTDVLGNPDEFGDAFRGIAEKLNDPARAQEGVNDLMKMAKRVQFLEDPHAIVKGHLGMKVAGSVWNEFWMNGLLSSPETMVTNSLGTIWTPARVLLQYGAAKAWAATGLWGTTEAKLVAAEAAASLAQMAVAFEDAWTLGLHAMRSETSLYQTTRRAISGEAINQMRLERGKSALSPQVAEIIDTIGQVLRVPSRAMLGMDEFSKHLALRGEVAARGVRRAAREGVDLSDADALKTFMEAEMSRAFDLPNPSKWEKWKVDSVYNMQSGLESGSGRTIAQIADEATFQEDNAVAGFMSDLMGKAPALRPFIPFVRTPTNILKQGLFEGTGVGPLWKGASILMSEGPTKGVLEIQRELLKDPNETFRIAGQIALTTALGATIYNRAMAGDITGGGPRRWVEGREGQAAQNAWVAAGNVPYAIRLGDAWVPFDRFGEPVAIALRMFADLGMHSAWMSSEDQDATFAGMVGIVSTAFYQASFLQGVENLSRAFKEDSARGEAVQNWVATQTPFSGLLSFVDRVTDPYKGAYGANSFLDVFKIHEATLGSGIFGKAAERFPGVRTAPMLIDQITGQPVPIKPGVGPGGLNPLQMAIPIMPRWTSVSPAWQTVFGVLGNYSEQRPQGGLKLTLAEQQRLNGLMATARIGGQTLAQKIEAFGRRPDVQQFIQNRGVAMPGSKTAIQRELKSIIGDYYSVAEAQLLQSDARVMDRALKIDALQLAQKGNDVGSATQLSNELDELLQRAERGY